jgi:hypothetical protein
MMTEFEELVLQDALTQISDKGEKLENMLKDYWNQMLNTDTTIDPMRCDGDSEPFVEWETEYGKQPYV